MTKPLQEMEWVHYHTTMSSSRPSESVWLLWTGIVREFPREGSVLLSVCMRMKEPVIISPTPANECHSCVPPHVPVHFGLTTASTIALGHKAVLRLRTRLRLVGEREAVSHPRLNAICIVNSIEEHIVDG